MKKTVKKMKLAMVCQVASAGGWNYLYLLVSSLKKCQPDWEITVFYKPDSTMALFDYMKKLQRSGVTMKAIPLGVNLPHEHGIIKKFIRVIKKAFIKIRNIMGRSRFISMLNDNDVIFYAWPYGIEPYDGLKKPMFFIPHDFIYTHWFGFHCGNWYDKNYFNSVYQAHRKFADMGEPIVSTPYIANEFKNTFPDSGRVPHVVYLTRFNEFEKIPDAELKQKLKKMGIDFPYLLWPSNCMYHKNIAPLLGAFYEIKQKYPNIKLILTGHNTKNAPVKCRSPLYCDHLKPGETDWDILGMGELSPDDFSVVLQGATAVINTSLCEAGAGSGLDAWSMGIPMIMSDIEPFRQQVEFLKTHAEFFDPRNSHDMADAILRVLDNPDDARKNAKESEKSIAKYTWDDVARQYAKIFMESKDEK